MRELATNNIDGLDDGMLTIGFLNLISPRASTTKTYKKVRQERRGVIGTCAQ
jgi:hypothetical protein